MAKVLLVNPPFYRLLGSHYNANSLGIAYIATDKGISVLEVPLNTLNDPDSLPSSSDIGQIALPSSKIINRGWICFRFPR